MTMELFPNLYYYVTNYKDNEPNNIAGMVNDDRRDYNDDNDNDNDNEKMCDEVDDGDDGDDDDDGNVDDFNSDETASHMSFFENLKLEVKQYISDIISTDPDNEDSFANFLKTTASDISSFVFDNYTEPVKEEVLPMYLSEEDIAKHNLEGDQRRLQRLEQQTKKEQENLSNGHYL
uniref:Uncharacterized protein n=1 Tax=viral metagenome TaxID=1070528 RepID=A0A6C0EWW3_9ZZZZ